jgi:hypothetical protein
MDGPPPLFLTYPFIATSIALTSFHSFSGECVSAITSRLLYCLPTVHYLLATVPALYLSECPLCGTLYSTRLLHVHGIAKIRRLLGLAYNLSCCLVFNCTSAGPTIVKVKKNKL